MAVIETVLWCERINRDDKAMSNPLPALMDKALQETLGVLQLEIVRLRAMNAAQALEIQRLVGELREATETQPSLPLAEPREAANGHAH